MYDPASRREAARLAVKDANFNAMKVEEDDVVIVCSDGITDNLNKEDMRNIIEAGMHQSLGPHDLARELVSSQLAQTTSQMILAHLLASQRKPTEVIVAGYVGVARRSATST